MRDLQPRNAEGNILARQPYSPPRPYFRRDGLHAAAAAGNGRRCLQDYTEHGALEILLYVSLAYGGTDGVGGGDGSTGGSGGSGGGGGGGVPLSRELVPAGLLLANQIAALTPALYGGISCFASGRLMIGRLGNRLNPCDIFHGVRGIFCGGQ